MFDDLYFINLVVVYLVLCYHWFIVFFLLTLILIFSILAKTLSMRMNHPRNDLFSVECDVKP